MIEFLIITLLVLWSCVVVFKKLMPKTANHVFMWFANFCQAQGWQKLAKWLKPKAVTGCGGSCDCSGESTKQHDEVKTVKWK